MKSIRRHRAVVTCLLAGLGGLTAVSGCGSSLTELSGVHRMRDALVNAGIVNPPADAIMVGADGLPNAENGTYSTGPQVQASGQILADHQSFPGSGADTIQLTGGFVSDSTGYLGQGPAVAGKKLGLRPGQTASEKALELQAQLAESRSREEELEARVAQLESEIDRKDARLVEAIREMNATRQELISVRGQLETWSQTVTDLRGRIQAAQTDNTATMQTIIGLLQQFLQVESDMRARQRQPIDLDSILDQQNK